jgi:hypothetical protein
MTGSFEKRSFWEKPFAPTAMKLVGWPRTTSDAMVRLVNDHPGAGERGNQRRGFIAHVGLIWLCVRDGNNASI